MNNEPDTQGIVPIFHGSGLHPVDHASVDIDVWPMVMMFKWSSRGHSEVTRMLEPVVARPRLREKRRYVALHQVVAASHVLGLVDGHEPPEAKEKLDTMWAILEHAPMLPRISHRDGDKRNCTLKNLIAIRPLKEQSHDRDTSTGTGSNSNQVHG